MKRFLLGTVAAAAIVGFYAACSDNPSVAPRPRAPSASPRLDVNASSNGEGQCMFLDSKDAGYKQASLQCTANDVDIGEADVTKYCVANVPFDPLNPACNPTTDVQTGQRISCTPGQHIYARVTAVIQNSAQARYDMGLWILDAGLTGDANTGAQCKQYNLIPGQNGAVNLDGDQCGDVNATTTTINVPLDVMDFVCPSNGQSTITLQACAGWSNSTTGSNDIVCPIDPPGGQEGFRLGTTPPEGSKCKCNALPLNIDVKSVLRIKKVTDPTGSAQSFGFTTTGTDYTTPFSLTDGQTNPSGPLSAGTYTAAETVPSNWDLTGRSCVNTADNSAHTFSNITNGVSVALGSGEDVTCTFTNTKHPTLTLVKRIVNDNGGTATVSAFGITTTAGSLTFGSGVADGTNTLKYTSNTITGLSAGAYTLHEGTLTGYDEGTWSCTAGNVTNTTPASGSVTLANGQDAVCTITNNDQGASLTLVKRIVNDNGGTATVSAFGITTTAGSLTFGSGVADGTNTLKYTSNTLTGLSAGAYSLHEGTLTGYNEGTWSCDVGNVTNTTPASGSVTLSGGQSATCTITNNDQPASLTIVKRIVNDNGGTATVSAFGITTTAGSLTFGSGVADGTNTLKYTATTLTGLSAGAYSLHEGTLTGYDEGTWSCDVGNVTNTTPASGSVTLANGQSATCTITNNDQSTSLTIVKRIVNDNGGTATVSAFGITTTAGSLTFGSGVADGTNTLKYTSNTITGLSAGAYSLHEGTLTGYDEGTWSCTAGNVTNTTPASGSVTLSGGQSATCTITNNDQPASLTIVKRIVNDNGGTATVSAFGITTTAGSLTFGSGVADGTNTLKYTATALTGLSAGAYSLHEGTLTGYTEGTWSCTAGNVTNTTPASGSVTLANGQSATCTITNDDQAATLILVKVVKGAGGTFSFNLSGDGLPSTQSLTPATDGQDSHTYTGLSAGVARSITEVVPSGYILTDLGCSDQAAGTYDPTLTQTVSTTIANGATVTCTFVNEKQVSQTTRTQGFWATHRSLLTQYWGTMTLCGQSLTIPEVLGGFWSNISQTSTNSKRTKLDQARMQLLQQLLAAKLNNAAFGSSPLSGITIAQAETAFCSGTLDQVQSALQAMAAFNTSGDNGVFTPGVSANGKDAKSNADISFWDTLP